MVVGMGRGGGAGGTRRGEGTGGGGREDTLTACSPSLSASELRIAALPVIFDIMKCEQVASSNFKRVGWPDARPDPCCPCPTGQSDDIRHSLCAFTFTSL